MLKTRWLLALPLAFAAMIGSARAATVRDNAGMFSPDAVRQAETTLGRIERDSGLTTTIETVDSLRGESIQEASLRHAQRSGTRGLYVLIAKNDHKLDVRYSRG